MISMSLNYRKSQERFIDAIIEKAKSEGHIIEVNKVYKDEEVLYHYEFATAYGIYLLGFYQGNINPFEVL